MYKTAVTILFVILFAAERGQCLKCLSCNVTMSALDNSPCSGISQEMPCAPNSVCLSGTYEVGVNPKSFRTIKSCYMDSAAADECNILHKAMKNLYPPSTKLNPLGCYSCRDDTCNSRNDVGIIADSANQIISVQSLMLYATAGTVVFVMNRI